MKPSPMGKGIAFIQQVGAVRERNILELTFENNRQHNAQDIRPVNFHSPLRAGRYLTLRGDI